MDPLHAHTNTHTHTHNIYQTTTRNERFELPHSFKAFQMQNDILGEGHKANEQRNEQRWRTKCLLLFLGE